ncbi:hypothetical protein [Arthrobacter sp. H14-L1]|uniref:hypothetical protein n=1 Tax=Arthrobacter sp. H14-L1 TaxID=2996697 RepID=UPI00226D6932|nr:hypothetical protein [Arthrobacter sp. H14-L1]MCY0905766.1 hypothetical protein [Arthrobacter sp. H14-L1]
MGKYDKNIASAQTMLAEAQHKYDDALVKMTDAAPHVRQMVLNTYQEQIDEANQMIEIFTSENERLI